jgi:multidrug efflux pump subunit AcrA (membrane-fusion protein)
MNRKAILPVLAVSAVLWACAKAPESPAEKAAPPEISATVATVAPAPVEAFFEAVGTVRSRTTSPVSAQILGRIVAIHAREGDRVRSGEVLLEIDPSSARTQLEKAQAGLRQTQKALAEVEMNIGAGESAQAGVEANLELAAATFERYQVLQERGSVSRQEFDVVQARYKTAQAEVKRAQQNTQALRARRSQVLAQIDQAKAGIAGAEVLLGYTRVDSPISGMVTSKSAELGMMATPGVPLYTVEDPTQYRLEAMVEDSRVGAISVGGSAIVRIDALGGREIAGRVAEIVPSTDAASRTDLVKVDLLAGSEEAGPPLRSGLFGVARFPAGRREALLVPLSAIVEQGQLTGVFVVGPQDIARLRLVKTGREREGKVEILSGLKGGEKIVVEGTERVADGDRVQ